jgi:hypothetical protein
MMTCRLHHSAILALLATGILGISTAGAWAQGKAEKKEDVPPLDVQNKTLELVREVFKKEYAEAKSVAQKEVLAGELLQRGTETKDVTERFVLLRVARDLAAMVGDADTACRAIDEMARSYRIDAAAMKQETLVAADKGATLSKHFKAISEQSASLMEEAILRDDYELANQMIQAAIAAAKKSRDAGLTGRMTARAGEVEQVAKARIEVKEALVALEKDPVDPKANLAVGRYQCLYKGDWEKGLPMLALAGDGTYDVVAKQELVGPKTPDAQVAVADGWWAVSEKCEGMAKSQLRIRAGYWYDKAQPQLSGLTQMRVKKRLAELEPAEEEPDIVETPTKPGEEAPKVVRKKPNFEGTWQDRFGNVIEFKIDGRKVVGPYKNIDRSYGHEYVNYSGRILGTVSRDGKTLTAEWARTSYYGNRAEYSGTLVFQLSKDGNSFAGSFRQSDGRGGGVWNGMRVQPATGGANTQAQPSRRDGDGRSPKRAGEGDAKPRLPKSGDGESEPSFGPRPGEEPAKGESKTDSAKKSSKERRPTE